jgi:hypothetical protein
MFNENLSSDDYEIKRHLDLLDQVAIKYESKWGAGNLEHFIAPELATKWKAQREKLSQAIEGKNVLLVAELVQGSIRGYAALEQNAISMGHKHSTPDVMHATHPESGQQYIIAANNLDARQAAQQGARVYTLHEVVRILEIHDNLNAPKPVAKQPETTKAPMDWKQGDGLPF